MRAYFYEEMPSLLRSLPIAAGLLASQTSSASTASQNECVFFQETGKSLCNTFHSYWNTHCGCLNRGSPSRRRYRRSLKQTAKPTLVQYFERAVFESHPENKGTSSEVLEPAWQPTLP